QGATSAFALLDDLAADLRSNTNTGAVVARIDDRLSKVLSTQTTVGTRMNRLERAAESAAENQVGFSERLMAIEDVNLAELSIDLQLKQVAYQASLNIGASVLQTSLLDYLR